MSKCFALASLFLALYLCTQPSFAASITVNVINPSRTVAPGSIEMYTGTITNNTGTTLSGNDLFLNFSSYNSTYVTPFDLLNGSSLTLANGATTGAVSLLEFDLGGTTPPGSYPLLLNVEDINNNVSNAVTITETVPTPEPGAGLLCALGLGIFCICLAKRHKRVLVTPIVILFLHAAAFAQAISFGTGTPNVSVWPDNKTVAAAIPLYNLTDDSVAENVTITNVSVRGGTNSPTLSYPVVLGLLMPGGVVNAPVLFTVPAINGPTYLVTITGTYLSAGRTYGLSLNRPIRPATVSNGPFPSSSGNLPKQNPSRATYPPPPPPQPPDVEFNSPFYDSTPIGPPQNFFPSSPSATGLTPFGGSPLLLSAPRPAGPFKLQDAPFQIVRNTPVAAGGGTPPDPTVAGSDGNDIAMMASNTTIFYTTDSGFTFKQVNLTGGFSDPSNPSRTSFFPQDDGGLCCDQVLTFVPNQNGGLFFWLLQYWPSATGPNRLRIAWATPGDLKADFIHAWSYCDLTSAGVGIGNDWMDYPDLAFTPTSTGCRPLFFPLAGVARSSQCRCGGTRTGNSGQALGSPIGGPPDSAGNRRDLGGPRSEDLDWPPRPCITPHSV